MLLSRDEFREQCFDRDNDTCLVPWCDEPADEVHHIIERSLWPDGGYYKRNGASVCNPHHQYAESNNIPPHAFWRWIGEDGVDPLTPEGVPVNVNKWGPDGASDGRGETFETPPWAEHRDFHKYPSTRHLLPVYWHDALGSAESRTGRDDTGLTTTESFLNIPLVVNTKLDGCLPYSQELITKDRGAVKIGKIVNQEMDVEVLSYNFEEREKEFRPVTAYHKNGQTDKWLRINHDGESLSSRLVVTPNHEIYLADGSTKTAGELEPGDRLASSIPRLSEEQEELVVGSMLGDSTLKYKDYNDTPAEYLQNPFIQETHGIEQQGYSNWKCKMFGPLINKQYTYWGKFGEGYPETEKIEFRTQTIPSLNKFKDFLPPGQDEGRTVPDWLDLTPKSIAVWYCDDGTPGFSEQQRPRVMFSTNCFSTEGCEKLLGLLEGYDITGRVAEYGKGPRIELTADSSERLFELIAPYVPECMNQKLPKKYRETECLWEYTLPEIKPFCVTSIEPTETFSPVKFDIEVEHNHNYFSSQILVSNSNTMMVKDADTPVRARNGRGADHESFDRLKDIYWERNVYEALPEYLQVFGENMVAHHSIHYGCDGCHDERNQGPPLDDYFYVFGIFDTRYNLWLSWPEVEAWADTLGFPVAPVVDRCQYTQDSTFCSELSQLGAGLVDDGHEGFIVRSRFPFHYGHFGRRLGKYVRPHHVQTDEHWSHRPLVENKLKTETPETE